MRRPPLSYRLLSFALALLVLAASVGLPVQRRTCRLSGRSTTRIGWAALTQPEQLLPSKRSSSARLESNCYAFSLQVLQLKVSASASAASKLMPTALATLALPPVAWVGLPGQTWPAEVSAARSRLIFPPPRPAGRTLLVRMGMLVV